MTSKRSPRLISALHDWGRSEPSVHGVEPVHTAAEIAARVDELAASLTSWLEGEPVAQVIMNGAFMFAADLTRAMSARGSVVEMDFITLEKDRRAGTVSLLAASDRPVADRDVLIIDDIFETGHTLSYALDHYERLGAASVTSVVLLDKSAGRETVCRPDFTGFRCGDMFVVGYGMDVGHRFRELPFIGRMGSA
ncbi:phosphoribosyltransferase [Yunchengibacter salinarum]|uniref:phosphoribosyltransferase n=1 Tax=Yunchengibacter salinarum TaxID=3133399 RepID=UPI0035B64721